MTIDTATIALMQSIQTPMTVAFFKFIAILFDPITILIASFLVYVYLYNKFSKKQAAFFASTILFTAIIIKVLKAIFQRARPLTGLMQESGFSLPSGHVTMAIVFFGLLIYLFVKKRKMLILVTVPLVIIIAFSRLYLQAHWLTDVIAGSIVAGIILLAGIIFHKKLKI